MWMDIGQGMDREISVDVKTGVEAKNYDDVSNYFISYSFSILVLYLLDLF